MEDPERLYECLETYYTAYEEQNNAFWADKLGLDEFQDEDETLVTHSPQICNLLKQT